MAAYRLTKHIGTVIAKVGYGASARVPATRTERLVSVRSRDLRRGSGQWARRADSGRSGDRALTVGLDHLKSAFGRGKCKF